MVWLLESEKSLTIMFICFDTILACDEQTDGRTDGHLVTA